MRKEIATDNDGTVCTVCARTLLKGERTEAYIASSGERRQVCDLCRTRVEEQGWVREALHGQTPLRDSRGRYRRRGLRGLLRRSRPGEEEVPRPGPQPSHGSPPREEPVPIGNDAFAEFDPEPEVEVTAASKLVVAGPASAVQPTEETRSTVRDSVTNGHRARPEPSVGPDPRTVRGVPVADDVKIERALDLFNASEHPRTVAGIARTLGKPSVTVASSQGSPSEVNVLVAWELSWYKFVVDLGDRSQSVHLQEKGYELDEISAELQLWNAHMNEDGRIER